MSDLAEVSGLRTPDPLDFMPYRHEQLEAQLEAVAQQVRMILVTLTLIFLEKRQVCSSLSCRVDLA